MPRFFVPPEQLRGGRFSLTGSEAHHARDVLRKKVGDSIELFDGKDASLTGRIDTIDTTSVGGSILDALTPERIRFRLVLGQALLKGPRWDWLLEKACEIGVSELVPLLTERTLIRPKSGAQAERLERWNRISMAASKQCGRADLMRIHPPVEFVKRLGQIPKETLCWIPWEKEEDQTVANACAGMQGDHGELWIGPEGGWTAEEVERARRVGAATVRLGPTLLRSETAGLVAATLILREFGVY